MKLPSFRKATAATEELTCKQLVQLVTDYLEGALSATDHRRFEVHLKKCDGCSAYLIQMRDTIRISGVLTEESLDPHAKDELLSAFRTWKQRRQ